MDQHAPHCHSYMMLVTSIFFNYHSFCSSELLKLLIIIITEPFLYARYITNLLTQIFTYFLQESSEVGISYYSILQLGKMRLKWPFTFCFLQEFSRSSFLISDTSFLSQFIDFGCHVYAIIADGFSNINTTSA